jgi:hypothetical protein
MWKGSKSVSHEMLCALAMENARDGGKGWANAMLTLPLQQLTEVYRSISPIERNHPIYFENHQLDETVSAVLEDVTAPKYQRV